ncbi:MAG: sensor histidine kinase KdpD [Gammaproteobacteria bacterium]
MPRSRPNPETLLEQADEEERLQKKGKLKIFFGAAPGVGKTYSMLTEALSKLTGGLDVVIGVVESHGRKDIEILIEKFEAILRCNIEYRNKQLQEFDLEAAIKRHPTLIMVDEMAHTNIAGVMHTKRWQDIKELLERGIDVYTTLNVQHIESLNDVIKQITGVIVHETVPDSILELADSIELVDLPPEDLLKRLEDGKIYIPAQAELALQHFFRKANLSALRELALRFTAERVNQQVQTARRDISEQKIWPTSERLLVCIDHSTFSIKLIRTARRMATSLQAEWLVIYVDSAHNQMSEVERQIAIENLRFAKELGAETSILSGDDLVKEIIEFSHINNITKIIIGKKIRPRWRDMLFSNLSDEIVRASNSIDVYIITGEADEFKIKSSTFVSKQPFLWLEYLYGIITVGVCTLINYFSYPFLLPTNLVLIYLLGVVFMAARGQLGPSIMTALVSLMTYALLFVPVALSFTISDAHYLITFLVMLLITELITHLTMTAKKQSESTRLQERRTAALYRLNRELASHRGTDRLLQIAVNHISDVFDCDVLVLLPGSSGHLMVRSNENQELDVKERSIAQWSYDLGQMAGLGTTTLPSSKSLYYPMQGTSDKIAVLRIQPKNPDKFIAPEQLHLLETIIRQVILAIEVDRLQEEVKKSQIEIEVKGLRSILLSSIARELQIPLADIQSLLKHLIDDLDKIQMAEPAQNIQLYSDQLNRLIEHFLQTLQLEAGVIELKTEPHALEKIINSALIKVKKIANEKPIILHFDSELPTIQCDKTLLVRALINLIENAIKYTPTNTPLDISAKLNDKFIEISVADQGQGIGSEDLEKIFEKFYRGQNPPKSTGAGLGLFICRSIIQMHGGRIWVEPRVNGGSIFKFVLPI